MVDNHFDKNEIETRHWKLAFKTIIKLMVIQIVVLI